MTMTTMGVLHAFMNAQTELSGADFINHYGMFSGTLYPILRRLEEAGWIRGFWEDIDPTIVGRPRRKFYKLTVVGEREARQALNTRRAKSFFGEFGPDLKPQGA